MLAFGPLFREASRTLQRAAAQGFLDSTAGQLVRAAVAAKRRPALSTTNAVNRAMERFSASGWRPALQTMTGTEFGDLARQIERFARGGGGSRQALVDRFLHELGPVGGLIKALIANNGEDALSSALELGRAMGYEWLPPPAKRRRGEAVTERGIQASIAYLQEAGILPADFQPIPGGQVPPRGSRFPFGISEKTRQGRDRQEVSLPMADGPARRFPVDHPIVTGEMIDVVGSSNVHSFGYDIEAGALYVRFLATAKGTGSKKRAGPGPLYRYTFVTPEEFLLMLKAHSKGDWIWEHLRIRHTHSGHQKDYALVGIIGGYVPRKAVLRPMFGEGGQVVGYKERFETRRVLGLDRQWYRSRLEEQDAPGFGYGPGQVSWGLRPDNGAPERPDTGRP